jgi:hypothetical protein
MAASLTKITFFVLTLVVLVRAEDISEPGAVKAEGSRRIVKRSVQKLLKLGIIAKAKELLDILGQNVVNLFTAESVVKQQPVVGSQWISFLNGNWGSYNGKLISCFYHPTRRHTAATDGKLGVKRSVAEAGHWACSVQTRALWKNKTYWNVL